MLIDWFTVGAQTLNFLILVWLMKRYLYQPVLHAIDAREKRIKAELADADTRKAEAAKQYDEFQQKNAEFDKERAAMLGKATDEAKAEGQSLLEEARKAADALSAQRKELLQSDARNLNESVSRRAQEEIFAIARKTLMDLGGISLEQRVSEVFAGQVRALNGTDKDKLSEAIKNSAEPARIRSAFELPPEQQAALQNAINETFSADIPLRFETAPDIVSGIELSASGQKVAWSIADYLNTLEQGIAELLKKPRAPEKSPEALPS